MWIQKRESTPSAARPGSRPRRQARPAPPTRPASQGRSACSQRPWRAPASSWPSAAIINANADQCALGDRIARDGPALARALAALHEILRRWLGRRSRCALSARFGLDHRRLPGLGDVLHLLVDQQTIGVALAVRRRQLPGAGDLDLIADLVGRAHALLLIGLRIAAIGRGISELV